MTNVISRIVDLWSDVNPVAGYTSGYRKTLTALFKETSDNLATMRARIQDLRGDLDGTVDKDLRATAGAVLTLLKTQLDLPRPSGAGPSGTGMGGVYAAADGVFYIVLKGDAKSPFV